MRKYKIKGISIVEAEINGCKYVLINAKFFPYNIGKKIIQLMFMDPMYHLISAQKNLYIECLNHFKPEIMYHFTTDSSFHSNDPNAHPENLQKYMYGTGFKRRHTFNIVKYNFLDKFKNVPFGFDSHGKHVPVNDTDCLVAFVHKDTTVREHWDISNLERSRTLTKYIQDFEKENVFKPKSLYSDFIQAHTYENGWVVDMDACSGNSLDAAIDLKRNYIGYEVHPDFFTKLIEKLENYEKSKN